MAMVEHLVMWNFKDGMTEQEKDKAFFMIREKLTALLGVVDGVESIRVEQSRLPGSSHELALISSFRSVEALNAYQIHPAHQEAAGYVRSVTCGRVCFDYERK